MATTTNNKVFSTFHSGLYIILLVGGVVASLLATLLIIDRALENTQGDFGTLTWYVKAALYSFLFGNCSHLVLIYGDLLLMERYPEKYRRNFAKWFDTRLEIVLRLSAFALLILAVGGKIIPLLDAISSQPSSDRKMWGFIVGNLALFSTLCFWDIFAIYRQDERTLKSLWRPSVYLVSDGFALACWALIRKSVIHNRISSELAVLLLISSLIYLLLMIGRIALLIPTLRQTPDTTMPPTVLSKKG